MRIVASRCLVRILAAWIGLLGAALPAAATVGERPTLCASNAGVATTEFAIDAQISDRCGDRHKEAILDDQDVIDQDAASVAGLEDPPSLAVAGEAKHQRFSAATDFSVFHSTVFVEPRFLRYCRLLN
ncbi:MAG: hypothetical protein HY274_09980 [Gammaproteobacteria bacterium]|nr:hypothetical protein [Gammaproteobacteria bacterium]